MAAASPPSPPPPTTPPPALATIAALGDDVLREIFLRLPDVATLARAAFACHAFLHAVRSSPAFRRRFRELHAPPLLALFLPPDMSAIVPAAAGKGSDIAAAFNDLLLQDSDASERLLRPAFSYYNEYAYFVTEATHQSVCYNPHSQAVKICPQSFHYGNDAVLEFHTLSPDGEEKRPSRVVCVHRDHVWPWRVAIFSSHTMEWDVVLPEMKTGTLPEMESYMYATGTAVNGFVYWVHCDIAEGCILVLNTATFQYFLMDLPPPLKVSSSMFHLGQTKDGKICVVSVLQCVLSVWLWAADDVGVERLMLHKTFPLRANVSKITKLSEEADVGIKPVAVINGFVYLSLYLRHPQLPYIGDPQSPEWFLSFCLETDEMNLLYKESQCLLCKYDPYIMVSWPSSLINSKEDSETGVTGNISEDDGHMGTEETSHVLFTALLSFKEKLIDDGNLNFAKIDSFLLDDERNSLLSRIATLESRLAAARNCVLRIGTEPNSMSGMELVTSESQN